MKVDIIGGGLAGLSTAISMKKMNSNIQVIIHEKYKEIGYNPEGRRCGEGHTIEASWKEWKPDKISIFNNVTTVLTHLGNKTYTAMNEQSIGVVLNRQEFIHQLGEQARLLEIEIQTNDRIKSVNDLDGDYLIDASGCPSTVKKELEIDKGLRGISYQQTIQDSNCFKSDTLHVYFSEDIVGYYWIFPRNPKINEVNIGVGTLQEYKNIRLKDTLESFKTSKHITGVVNHVAGGLVPAGLQPPVKYGNILFVGDAGVGTHPILGKGIYRALLSGKIAGQCIAEEQPNKYPKIIRNEFIKWDIIGKCYIHFSKLMKSINKTALFMFYRAYLDFWYYFFQ